MSESHVDNAIIFETTAPSVSAGDLFVRALSGVEALSSPYEFRITLECGVDGGLGPDTVGELLDATCQVGFGPAGVHRVSGVLRQMELVEAEADGSRSLYEAVLVPRLWLTTLTRRSRCFNEKSVPDIIKAVLGESGLADGTDFELRLVGSYAPREYVVQYEETDFNFLSRWMERLGMFYCFEQTDAGEKLVITDSNAQLVAAPDHGQVTYAVHETQGVLGAIHRLRRRDRRMPAKVHVRDYNWRTPAKPVTGAHDVDAERGVGLQAYYGDHFGSDADGATVARLRAEGFNATKQVFSGWTVNPDFSPGYRFTVSGAPVGELDLEYVLTRVVHQATQHAAAAGSGDYRNEVEMIAYDVPFRPRRVSPWPRVDGVMHAKIDAESVSSAAPIDDQGRYRVVVPFDLYGAFGGKASRWVRKAEPYAGGSYGMHMTLHVGAEVLLAHVGGDPDRPIIVASVPNPSMGTPLNASNATRSAIRTRSGILIDFEDDA
jgi:type VI secretion system secreted protein VgrG